MSAGGKMSRLDELIAELCPDGVEYKTLLSVANVLYGFPCDASQFNAENSGMPLIRIRDVLEGTTNTYTTEIVPEQYKIYRDDILIGMDGNFHLGKWRSETAILCQRVCRICSKDESTLVLNGFLYHLLKPLVKKIEDSKKGGTVKHLSAKDIKSMKIPLPPLEVQSEIVRILDAFTELTAELTAELEARKKQYEYYLDNFFGGSYEEMLAKAKDEMFALSKLSDVGKLTRGRRFVRDDVVEEGTPCFHYGDLYTYYGVCATETKTHLPPEVAEKLRFARKGDVVIVGAGENDEDIGIGVAWFGDKEAAVHDACYIFEHDMNPMYVSYYLRSRTYHTQIKKYVTSGKICAISAEGIGKSLIPVYPLEKQEYIVSILDRFDKLCTELTAEIEARRKQYEHYRDRLLTFKEKAA